MPTLARKNCSSHKTIQTCIPSWRTIHWKLKYMSGGCRVFKGKQCWSIWQSIKHRDVKEDLRKWSVCDLLVRSIIFSQTVLQRRLTGLIGRRLDLSLRIERQVSVNPQDPPTWTIEEVLSCWIMWVPDCLATSFISSAYSSWNWSTDPQRDSTPQCMAFGVPYSEHSSFFECVHFNHSVLLEQSLSVGMQSTDWLVSVSPSFVSPHCPYSITL